MPGENEKVAELEGQVTDLEAQVAKLKKQLEKTTGGDATAASVAELTGQLDEVSKALEDSSKALEELVAKNAELEKRAKSLDAIAKMSDDEKEYCKGMSDEDKEKFLAKEPDERKKDMEKRASDDETVVIDGDTIKKSAVGEVAFSTFKKMAKRQDDLEKQAAEDRNRAQMAELKKTADEKYAHVPGSVDERAQMLKAIDAMDESLRKSFTAVLEQSEKLAKAGFDKIGKSAPGSEGNVDSSLKKAAQDFDTKVAEIRKRDNSTRTEAIAKARKEHPELFKAYQGEQKTAS